jgi:hypothetical protein
MASWRRHLFYTRDCVKTTWKFRLGVLGIVILAVALTGRFWVVQIGRSLVCTPDLAPSDVILVENFDPNYLLFERAEALQRDGLAARVVVPVDVDTSSDAGGLNLIARGTADLMARQARLTAWEMTPIRTIEPISLNAAIQIRDRLRREHVTSVIVVTPGFRSRRSSLVYGAVFGDSGMKVRCDPVFGRGAPEGWTETWHGIQRVTEEFVKLQYYRFYALPFFPVKETT